MPVFINLPSDITKVDNNIPSGSGKTITSLTQTDGVISATFSDISIPTTQLSDNNTNNVSDVKYDTSTPSTPKIQQKKGTGSYTDIATITDNSSAKALSNSSTNLVTERSVALGGYAKSLDYTNSSGTTTNIAADANGVIDFTDLVITFVPD